MLSPMLKVWTREEERQRLSTGGVIAAVETFAMAVEPQAKEPALRCVPERGVVSLTFPVPVFWVTLAKTAY